MMLKSVQLLSPRRPWGRELVCAALRWVTLLCVLSLFTLVDVHAQELRAATSAVSGDNLDVALLTFGPGTEVWERFGHNAILVRDRSRGIANLYNYGIFDFDQENFFLNFARGHMSYRMAVDNFPDDLPMYRAEGRWIVEQDLNLTPPQRIKLADFLDWNARPENTQYRYEYFTANCSTRVRDALDAALDGAIKAQTVAPSRGFTYRMDTLRLMRPEVLLMLGMDAGLGPFADRRLSYWDESFVPMEFMRYLREVRVRDAAGSPQPLVAREIRLADARVDEPADVPPDWVWQALAIGIASALALLGLARLRARAWARALFAGVAGFSALVVGLGGLILIALWALTDHISAWRNENLLLLDPLCLLLLPAWIGAFRSTWYPSVFAQRLGIAIALFACLAFFIKVLPAFPQDNRFWIALLLPLHVALALSLARVRGHRV